MALLDYAFYMGIVKYALSAFTVACMVGFIYSFIEQLFPNALLQRAIVSYDGPRIKTGFLLAAVGAAGLLVSLIMWVNNGEAPASMMQYLVAIVSAAIFDAGVIMYLTSARTQERVTS